MCCLLGVLFGFATNDITLESDVNGALVSRRASLMSDWGDRHRFRFMFGVAAVVTVMVRFWSVFLTKRLFCCFMTNTCLRSVMVRVLLLNTCLRSVTMSVLIGFSRIIRVKDGGLSMMIGAKDCGFSIMTGGKD